MKHLIIGVFDHRTLLEHCIDTVLVIPSYCFNNYVGNSKCTSSANKFFFLFLPPDSKIVVRMDPQIHYLECPFEGIVVLRVRSIDDFKCYVLMFTIFVIIGNIDTYMYLVETVEVEGLEVLRVRRSTDNSKDFHTLTTSVRIVSYCKKHFKSWNFSVVLGLDFYIAKLLAHQTLNFILCFYFFKGQMCRFSDALSISCTAHICLKLQTVFV